MPKYRIVLYKNKKDKEKNNVYKVVEFDGKYVEALKKGAEEANSRKCKDFDVPIQSTIGDYKKFVKKFKLTTERHPKVVKNTLSNIFTMRLIGNKTHGDLAEVGIAEFINLYMQDYSSVHVGKELYRAKGHEEDIIVSSEKEDIEIPISIKAYGDGPLQLSTDKDSTLWSSLTSIGSTVITSNQLNNFLKSNAIQNVFAMNILPLIYREKTMECNIMIFDFEKAISETKKIELIKPDGEGNRKHPIFAFKNDKDEYICEVRYGSETANALQRGLWTNTKRASQYFNSVTNGWITYEHNERIIELIKFALNSSPASHEETKKILLKDIEVFKIDEKI